MLTPKPDSNGHILLSPNDSRRLHHFMSGTVRVNPYLECGDCGSDDQWFENAIGSIMCRACLDADLEYAKEMSDAYRDNDEEPWP